MYLLYIVCYTPCKRSKCFDKIWECRASCNDNLRSNVSIRRHIGYDITDILFLSGIHLLVLDKILEFVKSHLSVYSHYASDEYSNTYIPLVCGIILEILLGTKFLQEDSVQLIEV